MSKIQIQKTTYNTESARKGMEIQAKHIRDQEHKKGNSSYTYEQALKVTREDQKVIDRYNGK